MRPSKLRCDLHKFVDDASYADLLKLMNFANIEDLKVFVQGQINKMNDDKHHNTNDETTYPSLRTVHHSVLPINSVLPDDIIFRPTVISGVLQLILPF